VRAPNATRVVAEELRRLAYTHGGPIDAELVVDVADRNKKSALYAFFRQHYPWDDAKQMQRLAKLEAARCVICSVKILPSVAEALNCSVLVRQFHGELGGGYYDIETVAHDERLREELLAAALRDLLAIKARYSMLKELAAVFAAVGEVETPKRKKKGRKKKGGDGPA